MKASTAGGLLLIGAALFYVSRNVDTTPPITVEGISTYMAPMYLDDQSNKSRIYREVANMIERGATDSEIGDYMVKAGGEGKEQAFGSLYDEYADLMSNTYSTPSDQADALKEFSNKIGGIDD